MAILLFALVFAALLCGYPVAFTLAGTSLLFALLGIGLGYFEPNFLETIPNRLFGIMTNEVLVAVPLFILMGAILERSRIAEELLDTIGKLFGTARGGLAIATVLVGMLLAASTGIVGAGVVTLGLLSLPIMLKNRYDSALATGTITASGTLGQIIPPSIVLIILGDVMATAYQQAQLTSGNFAPDTVSVGDLFLGALLPGLGLVVLYLIYLICVARFQPKRMPAVVNDSDSSAIYNSKLIRQVFVHLIPPIVLIVLVLGSILAGYATPTEAASIGCIGAFALVAIKGRLTFTSMKEAVRNAALINTQIFFIFIGASFFALVFRGYGGDQMVEQFLLNLPGEQFIAVLAVMFAIFLLGFFLDFIEITVILVPTVAPVLINLGVDPLWLGVMIALNLQTSFLTPPFGFALFYLRGVAPPSVATPQIYRGAIPFIILQLIMLAIVWAFPQMAIYLPRTVYE